MQIHDLNTGTPASGHYIAMDSGTDTYKATPGNVVPSYTSGDASSASSWTSVTAVATGLSFSTLINRITTMMKNVRYLYNVLGSSTFSTVASTVTGAIGNTALGTTATTLSGAIAEHESDLGNTDISSIGNGTVTGAISTLNSNLTVGVTSTKTTTGVGAVVLQNITKRVIYAESDGYIVLPYKRSAGGYGFKFLNTSDLSAVANESVTFTYYAI